MNGYNYAQPIADGLTRIFGTTFALHNTGGGCYCLNAVLESGLDVLVGSAIDGPLMSGEERDEYRTEHGHHGGYSAGIYELDNGSGLAYVSDERATTPEDVALLVHRALLLARSHSDDSDHYPAIYTDYRGVVTHHAYMR